MVKGNEFSGKHYRKVEAEIMKDLGLKPTPGSGAGEIHKEDGENDYLLAQLKTTAKESFKLNFLDVEKLEYHAMVSHKLPVFVIHRLHQNETYCMIKLQDIPLVAQYIETGEVQQQTDNSVLKDIVESTPKRKRKKKTVKSSVDARAAFYAEQQKEYEEKRWKRK